MIVRYVGSGTHWNQDRDNRNPGCLPCQVHSSAEGFGDAEDKLLALSGLERGRRSSPEIEHGTHDEPIRNRVSWALTKMGMFTNQHGDCRCFVIFKATHTRTHTQDCARPFGLHGENTNWLCGLGNAYPEMWFICVLVAERGPSQPLLLVPNWSEQYSGCRWRYAGTSASSSETSETSILQCCQYSVSSVEWIEVCSTYILSQSGLQMCPSFHPPPCRRIEMLCTDQIKSIVIEYFVGESILA